MSRSLRVVLALAIAAAIAPQAIAAEVSGCVDPETDELALDQQQVYVREADTKAGNLGALGVTGFPTWSEEEPAASVTEGAGAGYLVNSQYFVTDDNAEHFGLTLEGAFDGCLDTMLVELYAFLPTNRTGTSGNLEESAFTGIIQLEVDDELVAWPNELEMAMVDNPHGDATYQLRFALTDIHRAMLDAGVDPAGEHTLKLNVNARYINTEHAVFVFDTIEVPAGILFNGEPDAAYPALSAY
jgi:hypothetical protein